MSQSNLNNTGESEKKDDVHWFPKTLSQLDEGVQRISKESPLTDRVRIIIGEAGTLKSRIAYAFLANGFICSQSNKGGVILITSEAFAKQDLINAIREWASSEPADESVLVNPISPRFMSSSNFVFHLKLSIKKMKRDLKKLGLGDDEAFRVRVVIDNWNTIIDTHSSLQNDGQLLQAVLSVLREEGVLAMIVSTQPGSPTAINSFNRKHDLTRIEATSIHCWPVNFFGDRRIAVSTSIPGKDGRRTSVAEIGRFNGSQFRLEIKDDFDFYEDLESGKAKRVKLKVKLYSGFDDAGDRLIPSSSTYGGEVSALFGDLFSRSESRDDVVSFESTSSYDSFKEYIQNLDRGQLDETLVFQVDEFWSGNEGNSSFAIFRDKIFENIKIDVDSFPDSVFNKSSDEKDQNSEQNLLRVPLHKDFGLLLADRASWYQFRKLPVGDYFFATTKQNHKVVQSGADPKEYDYTSMVLDPELNSNPEVDEDKPRIPVTVEDVWNSLCVEEARFDSTTESLSDHKYFNPSWQMFFLACETVARQSGKRPFDVDLRTSESLSALVLEIWITQIFEGIYHKDAKKDLAPRGFCEKALCDGDRRLSLRELVEKYKPEFNVALRTATRFLPGRYRREQKLNLSLPDLDTVAIRTWFAGSASLQLRNPNLTLLRIPGKFCVRGDWYLAVAKGSRSMRLAESAMAKLLSESMNRKRLRDGIGLPVLSSSVKDSLDNAESALKVLDSSLSTYRSLRLSELKKTEPEPPPSKDDYKKQVKLIRLFRSEIVDYDATSEQFQLLISQLLRKLHPISDVELLNPFSEEKIGGSPGMINEEIDLIINDFTG